MHGQSQLEVLRDDAARSKFAAQFGRTVDDITHCVYLTTRGTSEVYAIGYWSPWAYTHGTAEYRDGVFVMTRFGHDMDLQR